MSYRSIEEAGLTVSRCSNEQCQAGILPARHAWHSVHAPHTQPAQEVAAQPHQSRHCTASLVLP